MVTVYIHVYVCTYTTFYPKGICNLHSKLKSIQTKVSSQKRSLFFILELHLSQLLCRDVCSIGGPQVIRVVIRHRCYVVARCTNLVSVHYFFASRYKHCVHYHPQAML